MMGETKRHTLHIRNLDDETYGLLWNYRKFHQAGSWAKLIKIIVKAYDEEIKQKEWI